MFLGEVPEGGHLASALAATRDNQERDSIITAIAAVRERGDYVPAAATGNRTAYHVLAASRKLSQTLRGARANKKRFWRHVEHLRSMRQIREGSIRRTNRHEVATLELVSQ